MLYKVIFDLGFFTWGYDRPPCLFMNHIKIYTLNSQRHTYTEILSVTTPYISSFVWRIESGLSLDKVSYRVKGKRYSIPCYQRWRLHRDPVTQWEGFTGILGSRVLIYEAVDKFVGHNKLCFYTSLPPLHWLNILL